MKTIIFDWSLIRDAEGFYDSVLPQTGAPGWHGYNLNAINDSWLGGGICSSGPPFNFIIRHFDHVRLDLKPFAESICGFAENCAMAHGGKVTYEEYSGPEIPTPSGTETIMKQKYEYKFVRLGQSFWFKRAAREDYQTQIQIHARDGWRLVQVFAPGIGIYGAATFYELILEREISQ